MELSVPSIVFDLPYEEEVFEETWRTHINFFEFATENEPVQQVSDTTPISKSSAFRILEFDPEFMIESCDICFEDMIEVSKFHPTHKCTNIKNQKFCNQCMAAHLKTKIIDNVFAIMCLACQEQLDYYEVMSFLNPAERAKYESLSLQQGLIEMSDFRSCPSPNCKGGGIIPPQGSFVICDDCKTKFCPTCNEEYHFGFTCEQRKQWKIENSESDAKTEQWKQQKTKNCPKCKSSIEKSQGCDHMTCSRCNYEFCWQCMEQYYDGHIREKHPIQRSPNQPLALRDLTPAQVEQLRRARAIRMSQMSLRNQHPQVTSSLSHGENRLENSRQLRTQSIGQHFEAQRRNENIRIRQEQLEEEMRRKKQQIKERLQQQKKEKSLQLEALKAQGMRERVQESQQIIPQLRKQTVLLNPNNQEHSKESLPTPSNVLQLSRAPILPSSTISTTLIPQFAMPKVVPQKRKRGEHGSTRG